MSAHPNGEPHEWSLCYGGLSPEAAAENGIRPHWFCSHCMWGEEPPPMIRGSSARDEPFGDRHRAIPAAAGVAGRGVLVTHLLAFNAGVIAGLVLGPGWTLALALAWLAGLVIRAAIDRLTLAEDRSTAQRRWTAWSSR